MDLFAQTTETTAESTAYLYGGGFFLIWTVIILLILIVAWWKVFEKAGEPGWKSIIPFYNTYTLVTIAGRPGWWFLLFFIPFVNFVVYIVISIDLAKSFGKSTAFGVVGLWLFSFVGFIILGWGDAKYIGADNQES